MITDALISGLLSIVKGFLSMVPAFSWNIENSVFGTFLDIVKSICYLLPIGTIVTILSLTVSFIIFKAVISLIKTIWDLLPIL